MDTASNPKSQNAYSRFLDPLLRFRPREAGALLDQAVVLYRRNFVTYVGIVALMQIPATALLTLTNIWLFDPATLTTPPVPPRPGAGPGAFSTYQAATVTAMSDLLSRAFLAMFVAILSGVLLNIAGAALARAIADGYMGRPIGVRAAYRAVRPKIGSLTGLIFLLGLAAFAFIIPPLGIWIFISWSFAAQAIVIEGANLSTGLQRSWELVRGTWWRVFGIYLLLLLIGVIVSFMTTLVQTGLSLVGASWAVQNIGTQFVTLLLNVLYLPIRLAGMTLLYFDIRVRKEGLDLQMALDRRAADLGLEAAAPGPGGLGAAWPYQQMAPAALPWGAPEVAAP